MNKPVLWIMALVLATCTSGNDMRGLTNQAAGSLFIIGGGSRPAGMMQELLDAAGWAEEDYMLVFPMASEEPDSSFFYTRIQFESLGIRSDQIYNYMTTDPGTMSAARLDSVRHARIIYLPGGDQKRFMDVVRNTALHLAIKDAYSNGAMIAGTSAGAAVMSLRMITGNQVKYPDYTGNFRTIESGNIELAEGLGFLENAVIDQHFIRRSRMNRLISVIIENPGLIGIGIDESTAILVQGDSATVVGQSQVIVLRNPGSQMSVYNDLIGSENLRMDVMLPGSRFSILP